MLGRPLRRSVLGNQPPRNGILDLEMTDAHRTLKDQLAKAIRLHQSGQIQEAIALHQTLLKQFPGHPHILHLSGLAQQELGDLRTAMNLLSQAVAREPENGHFLLALGIVLKELGHSRAALERLQDAQQRQPTHPEILFHLGDTQIDLGEAEAAITPFRAAIQMRPDFKEAWINLGLCLKACGRLQEALEAFQQVVALYPDCLDGRINLGLTQLLMGQYASGWRSYEWRLRATGEAACFTPPAVLQGSHPPPRWQGEPLAGKTLLVVGEQGFGDTIQFVRYLPRLKAAGARVLLTTSPSLIPLLSRLDAIDRLSTPETLADPEPIDYHVPLLSLPMIFNTQPHTIPADIPYLHPNPDWVNLWKNRLDRKKSFYVGLVWQGKPLHQNDPLRRRSCPGKELARLATIPGITWVNLQKREGHAQPLSLPAEMPSLDLSGVLHDFAHTAAILAALDLLISIDTSVAHLGGALGKPVWILLPFAPDWRWSLDPERTPWYPTARLFRQTTPNGWKDPLQRIATALPLLMHAQKEE